MTKVVDEGHGYVHDKDADPRCQCGYHGSGLQGHLDRHTQYVTSDGSISTADVEAIVQAAAKGLGLLE